MNTKINSIKSSSSKLFLLSSMIGLSRALENKEIDETSSSIILNNINALFNGDDSFALEAAKKSREEKFRIAPDCAVCASPCGKTADGDISSILGEDSEKVELRLLLLNELYLYSLRDASNISVEFANKIIYFIGYNCPKEYLENMLIEAKNHTD